MNSSFETEQRKRTNPLHQYLGDPVTVNAEILQECASNNSFSPLAFKLFEEAMKVLAVCSHTYSSSSSEEGALPRNQAICAGLLVRIVKVMKSIATLVIHTPYCADMVFALNRFITESATGLRFLVVKNEDRFFDQFVRFSLSPERELYDLIQKNVTERGGDTWAIERRMLKSIEKLCRLSGVDVSSVKPKASNWDGGLRNRLIAIGEGDTYAMQQRLPSHAVHGTWVDLIHDHLTPVGNKGFRPNPDQKRVDTRLMLPVCVPALTAAHAYVETFIPPLYERKLLLNRITDLIRRVLIVDEAHETWINSA